MAMYYFDTLFIRLEQYADDPINTPNPYIKYKDKRKEFLEKTLAQISLPEGTYERRGWLMEKYASCL